MPVSRPQLSLTHILARLLVDRGWKPQQLVEATGLPQATISNILRGKTKNPKSDTLKIIAEVFGIKLGQLVGYEPLGSSLSSVSSKNSVANLKFEASALVPTKIPLIQWSEVKQWILGQAGIKAYTTWLNNDNVCKSPKAFALTIRASMNSYFCNQLAYTYATLLIDPDASVEDGLLILVFFNESQEPSLRLLAIDGDEKRLQSLEAGKPEILLSSEHSVVGPVVEVRYRPNLKKNK
jgi:transcriptional regulator with XRE-family HTH domain